LAPDQGIDATQLDPDGCDLLEAVGCGGRIHDAANLADWVFRFQANS
jgi:hypothetical protein